MLFFVFFVFLILTIRGNSATDVRESFHIKGQDLSPWLCDDVANYMVEILDRAESFGVRKVSYEKYSARLGYWTIEYGKVNVKDSFHMVMSFHPERMCPRWSRVSPNTMIYESRIFRFKFQQLCRNLNNGELLKIATQLRIDDSDQRAFVNMVTRFESFFTTWFRTLLGISVYPDSIPRARCMGLPVVNSLPSEWPAESDEDK